MSTPLGRAIAPLAALTLSLAGWAAQAQAQAPATRALGAAAADPARADPLDAQAAVPASIYRSALALPPATERAKAPSWRQANDEVARIGGWRAYAREAQQPDPAPQSGAPAEATKAPPQPMPATMPQALQRGAPQGNPHSGHHGPKTP